MSDLKELADYIYYFIYCINFMGILGNICSFIVFSRPTFAKSSIGVYCKFLALFDLFTLFNLVNGLVGFIIGYSPLNNLTYICQLGFYITVGISPIPGWILVLFSIDQLITVSMTKRFGFIKTKWFQYVLIAAVFLFHCGIYSPVVLMVDVHNITDENGTVLFLSCDSFTLILPLFYLVESSLVPFTVMIVTTSRIVQLLVQSRHRTSELGSNQSAESNRSETTTAKNELKTPSSIRRARNLKYGFNSVILNILFIILTFPVVVLYIFPQYDFFLYNLIDSICMVFFYLNFALHFWVHFAVNSIFRNQFLILLRIKK